MSESTAPRSQTGGMPGLWLALAIAMLLITAVRIGVAGNFDLFPDEALYAWLAGHAPFTYCPHPPGTPLLAAAGMALLGKTEIAVRLGSIVLATFTSVLVFLLAKAIGGLRLALWSTLTCAAVPIYAGIGAVCTPDAPQLFIWALALLFTWRGLETGRAAQWLAAGIVLGLGLHVKYILVLYYPTLLLALLLVPRWRRHFRSWPLYASVAIAGLLFVPVAAYADWRAGWPALRYHLSDRQEFIAPGIKQITEYQLIHAGYISPLLYVGAIIAMVWSGARALHTKAAVPAFLFAFSVVPFGFFLVVSAFTERELSREQWDAPAYLTALIALVLMVGERCAPRKTYRGLAVAALLLGYVMVLLAGVEAATGVVSGRFGLRSAFSTLSGWEAMSRAADSQLARLPDRPTFVLGNSFHFALEYAFYGRETDHVYTLNHRATGRYGLSALLKEHGLAQDAMRQEAGRSGVFIIQESPDASENDRAKNTRRATGLKAWFDSVDEVERVTVQRYNRVIKYYRIFRCINLKSEDGEQAVPPHG